MVVADPLTRRPTDEPSSPSASASPSQPGTGSPIARSAVADLARRRGLAPESIAVRAVEAVTWRDGSLGCARKGFVYTQALVEGTRVVLEVDGDRVEYHSAVGQDPVLCEDPTQ